jgi:hypothetical protein
MIVSLKPGFDEQAIRLINSNNNKEQSLFIIPPYHPNLFILLLIGIMPQSILQGCALCGH